MPEVSTHSQSVSVAGGTIELSWAGATHTGRRREINQDALACEYPLFIVADGMGGHIGGEIASASTVDRLGGVVTGGAVTPKTIEKALSRAVKDIASHPETTDDGTGTTLTGVYLDISEEPPHWVTLNIGDSRVYLLRDGAIEQITTDHSVVQELIAAGRLSPEEAENHPYGNVITRAVGPSESVTPRLRAPRRRRRRPVRHLLGRAHERAHRLRHPALPGREPRPCRRGERHDGCGAGERRS